MDTFLELLYVYLDSLKWPIIIGLFVYYFRNEIRNILQNGFSVKHGNTEINIPQNNQNIENNKTKEEKEEIEKITENKTEEEISKLLKDNQNKDSQIFKLKLEKHFEYTYRLIFRSQIILLQNLQIIIDGYSPIQIDSYFQNMKEIFPSFIHGARRCIQNFYMIKI